MDEEKKVMLQEIAMQPDFVRTNVEVMLEASRKALAEHPSRAIGVGYAIGCGDSYCAALVQDCARERRGVLRDWQHQY